MRTRSLSEPCVSQLESSSPSVSNRGPEFSSKLGMDLLGDPFWTMPAVFSSLSPTAERLKMPASSVLMKTQRAVPVKKATAGVFLDPDPVVQFNTLYMTLFYEGTAEHGAALLAFLKDPHHQEILERNALYQIPAYPGAIFKDDYRGACTILEIWLEAGAPRSPQWQWTAMWEWVNNIHYWCPNPAVMVSQWSDYLMNPRAIESKYIQLFVANPFNKDILSTDAKGQVPPYPHADFGMNWLGTRTAAILWAESCDRAIFCFNDGPDYQNVVNQFKNLERWCPVTSRYLGMPGECSIQERLSHQQPKYLSPFLEDASL